MCHDGVQDEQEQGRMAAERSNEETVVSDCPRSSADGPLQMLDPALALLTGRGRYLDDTTLIATFTRLASGNGSGDLAPILIRRYETLASLLTASPMELNAISGIGRHIVPALHVLHETAMRYNRARLDERDVLADESRLIDYLGARLARETVEQFRVLFLSEDRRLIADEAQARGTVNHTPVYPREVARRAMELGAANIVLVHNHPSGDPTPSEADLAMTRLVAAATDAIGILTLDHIIIGNGRATSFRALGVL